MKSIMIVLFVLCSVIGLSAQYELNNNRYCVKRLKIYDFNTAKKLKNSEALHLLQDSPKALNLYEKSIKYKNAAWVSGTAFVGFAAYISGSTELKNEDFGDLNTTQKWIAAGFVGTAAAFVTSLVLHESNRRKSLIEFEKIINNDSSSYYNQERSGYKVVNLEINPLTAKLSLRF